MHELDIAMMHKHGHAHKMEIMVVNPEDKQKDSSYISGMSYEFHEEFIPDKAINGQVSGYS